MTLLDGVRVVDLTDGRGAGCGRYLADLGADVILIEPPGGTRSRRAPPGRPGGGAAFAAAAANKRSVRLDLGVASERDRFLDLVGQADIWIDGTDPGHLARLGPDLAPSRVCDRFPHLVVLSITEFGQNGPYRDRVATDGVHLALTPALSRSGVPGRPPVMPPGAMPDAVAGVQGAWIALLAYWNRLETGHGDQLDLSVFEATAQVLDPVMGQIGAPGGPGADPASRDRPAAINYPIFRCADGHVRVAILAPRQWRGMFGWLGEPAVFADPQFDQTPARIAAAPILYPLMQDLFRDRTMLDLVGEGQRRGVPMAPVLAPRGVLEVDHFASRQTFVDVVVEDTTARLPSGYVLVDGKRAGVRTPPPGPGERTRSVGWDRRGPAGPVAPAWRRPLRGLRVLDLGVIVMGAEAGRLFADQGAEVIKVESRRFPDGVRGPTMTTYFASSQRNKRSIGIDLRVPDGAAVFEQLVAVSDVVLTNFKPGTIESLGLGYERLAEVNPRIVLVTCSAMGESGPWRDWMGYGPLVRAAAGLTDLWRDRGVDGGFADATTIFPDHLVGRVVDVAVLAALIARRSRNGGAHIECSQAEAIINALAPIYGRESPGTTDEAPGTPWGIYPCAGDDEWCVITVRDDEEWARLVAALTPLDFPGWAGEPGLASAAGRRRARAAIDAGLAAWTAQHQATEIATRLQAGRVPAAPMQRVADFVQDPHLHARGFFRTFAQPGIEGVVTTENGPGLAAHLPDPVLRPAPGQGEHTREICREVLRMRDEDIERLIRDGVLEEGAGP